MESNEGRFSSIRELVIYEIINKKNMTLLMRGLAHFYQAGLGSHTELEIMRIGLPLAKSDWVWEGIQTFRANLKKVNAIPQSSSDYTLILRKLLKCSPLPVQVESKRSQSTPGGSELTQDGRDRLFAKICGLIDRDRPELFLLKLQENETLVTGRLHSFINHALKQKRYDYLILIIENCSDQVFLRKRTRELLTNIMNDANTPETCRTLIMDRLRNKIEDIKGLVININDIVSTRIASEDSYPSIVQSGP